MAGKEVKIRVSADTQSAEKEIKGFVAKGRKSLTSLANSFNEIKDAASSLVQGIAAVAGELLDMAGAASRFNQLENAMVGLAAQQGIVGDSFDDLKARMFAAADGMISKADLVKAANSAMLLGVDVQKFDQLIGVAKASAEATGQSVSFMLASITEGIGKAQPEILDNLGLSLKLGEVYDKAAAAIGTTAEKLTDFQKKTALTNAVLAAGQKTIDALGVRTMPTLAERLQQVNAKWDDMRLAIGQKLLPVVNVLAGDFVDAMDDISDAMDESEEDIDSLTTVMGYLGHIVTQVAVSWMAGVMVMRKGAGFMVQDIKLVGQQIAAFGKLGMRGAGIGAVTAEVERLQAQRDKLFADAGNWKIPEPAFKSYAEFKESVRLAGEAEKARTEAANASGKADDENSPKRDKHRQQVDALTAGIRAQIKAAEERALFEQGAHDYELQRMLESQLAQQAGHDSTVNQAMEQFRLIEEHKGQEEALTLFMAEQQAQRALAAAQGTAGQAKAEATLGQIRSEINKKSEDAEKASWQKRLGYVQQATAGMGRMFGDLASLQNRENARGRARYKALMRAQIVMNTATAAISSYQAMSGIPIVGPALGAAAAATAVAVGANAMQALESSEGFSIAGAIESSQAAIQADMESAAQRSIEERIRQATGLSSENIQSSANTLAGVPQAAHGALIRGSPTGSLIMAGENNRSEAIIPLENDEAMSKLGGLGGVTVNVTIMGSILSEEIPDRMREAIDTGLRELQISGRSVFAKELASV